MQCELKYKNGGQCNALYGHRLSLTLTRVTSAWIRLHLLEKIHINNWKMMVQVYLFDFTGIATQCHQMRSLIHAFIVLFKSVVLQIFFLFQDNSRITLNFVKKKTSNTFNMATLRQAWMLGLGLRRFILLICWAH